MIKQRYNTIAFLDVGSSKVICLIARISNNNNLEVIGVGHHISNGIKAGIITDLKAATNSIIRAVESAEKIADERVRRIYVNISSNNLLSHRIYSDLIVMGHEINTKDINKLVLQASDRYSDQPIEVIHSFVYDYILDGNHGIETPLGMYGNKLGCNLHIIASPSNIMINLINCLNKCELEVEHYISSSHASGLACLTPDERKLGVTLIELGAGCSSISVFSHGQLVFTDGIPLGGENITNDIAKGLCIDFSSAERIKILYGTVIFTASNTKDLIEVPVSNTEDGEVVIINRAMLADIIRARVEEIIELLMHKIRESHLEAFTNKVVIIGGTTKLAGIKELVSHIFSAKVRIGYSKDIIGLTEHIKDSTYLTSIGMILYAAEASNANLALTSKEHSGITKIWHWIKRSFL